MDGQRKMCLEMSRNATSCQPTSPFAYFDYVNLANSFMLMFRSSQPTQAHKPADADFTACDGPRGIHIFGTAQKLTDAHVPLLHLRQRHTREVWCPLVRVFLARASLELLSAFACHVATKLDGCISTYVCKAQFGYGINALLLDYDGYLVLAKHVFATHV